MVASHLFITCISLNPDMCLQDGCSKVAKILDVLVSGCAADDKINLNQKRSAYVKHSHFLHSISTWSYLYISKIEIVQYMNLVLIIGMTNNPASVMLVILSAILLVKVDCT